MGTKGTFVNEIFRFCLNISIKFSQKAQSLDLDVQLLLKLYSQNNLNYDNLTLERLKYCLLFRVCGCRKRSCNMKIVPSGNEHEFADYCCWGRPYFRHRRLKCRPLAPTRCFHTTRYIWQMKVSFSYSCKHWLILHSWAPVHISNQSLSLQKQNMIMAKHQSFKSRYYMRLFKPRFGQLNRKCTGVQLFTLEFYLTMFYPTPKPPPYFRNFPLLLIWALTKLQPSFREINIRGKKLALLLYYWPLSNLALSVAGFQFLYRKYCIYIAAF